MAGRVDELIRCSCKPRFQNSVANFVVRSVSSWYICFFHCFSLFLSFRGSLQESVKHIGYWFLLFHLLYYFSFFLSFFLFFLFFLSFFLFVGVSMSLLNIPVVGSFYFICFLSFLSFFLSFFLFVGVSRWHCTKSSDCQVRVRGAPSNVYGVNVTKAVIGAYM